MNLSSKLKNNLLVTYNNYKKSFKDLSYSSAAKLYASNSEELVLDSDKFKFNCCKIPNIKSVDAISFNNNGKILFIEFKIKTLRGMEETKLVKELYCKIIDMFKCFQHHIDQDNEFSISNIECWLVFTVDKYSPRDYDRYVALDDKIKANLEKMQLNVENINFNCCESQLFDKKIDYFKMHVDIKNSSF